MLANEAFKVGNTKRRGIPKGVSLKLQFL
jgi:hypothetical protein